MKEDDRITNTASIILSGDELRKMRQKDLARWKRRLHRSIEAQKWRYDPETTNMEDAHRMSLQNEAYDMALSIIGAKWKNI